MEARTQDGAREPGIRPQPGVSDQGFAVCPSRRWGSCLQGGTRTVQLLQPRLGRSFSGCSLENRRQEAEREEAAGGLGGERESGGDGGDGRSEGVFGPRKENSSLKDPY